MVDSKKILYGVFTYETPKIVAIRSLAIGIISRLVQLVVIGYIIGYVIIYKKGYQDFSAVESSVTTKVKGVVYTNFSDSEFNPNVTNKELYRRIWDVADYVVPPSENEAVFIATNVVITPNQVKGTCAEAPDVYGAQCDPNNNTCIDGDAPVIGSGVRTGRCIPGRGGIYTCEIQAWCPVENDIYPLKNGNALLAGSEEFTILIKNFVEFPKFKNSRRRNIRESSNKLYLQTCTYDPIKNKDCPIFRIGDIVKAAADGMTYNQIALKGAVIAIVIKWDCNLDFHIEYCFPTYTFRRLDDPSAKLAPGWNFRYAQYYNDDTRTLFKLYGIKFSIIVEGQAGKFSIVPFLLNVGAGLGLLAVQAVICDIVVLYFARKRKYYKSKKIEDVEVEIPEDEFASAKSAERGPFDSAQKPTLPTPTFLRDFAFQQLPEGGAVSSPPDHPKVDYGDDRYQRLVD